MSIRTIARPGVIGRRAVSLCVLSLAVFAVSAQAHTVTATATCRAVTFNWSSFSASGSTNGGVNAPTWKIVYTPPGGPATILAGQASFSGSGTKLTVAVPAGNATVVASSAWTAAQTRDANSDSGSTNLTIAGCPSAPTITTQASPDAQAGGSLHDTAVLTGGANPSGSISYTLYDAADTACAAPLQTVMTVVNGNGSFDSPAISPGVGTYQWIAAYSGDAGNSAVSGVCNDPTERAGVTASTITTPTAPPPSGASSTGTTNPVTPAGKGVCVYKPRVYGGGATARRWFSVHLAGAGVRSVTFLLDGRRIKTQTRAVDRLFSVKVDVRTLRYGQHRLTTRVVMRQRACFTALAAARTFVRVKSPVTQPSFTG